MPATGGKRASSSIASPHAGAHRSSPRRRRRCSVRASEGGSSRAVLAAVPRFSQGGSGAHGRLAALPASLPALRARLGRSARTVGRPSHAGVGRTASFDEGPLRGGPACVRRSGRPSFSRTAGRGGAPSTPPRRRNEGRGLAAYSAAMVTGATRSLKLMACRWRMPSSAMSSPTIRSPSAFSSSRSTYMA